MSSIADLCSPMPIGGSLSQDCWLKYKGSQPLALCHKAFPDSITPASMCRAAEKVIILTVALALLCAVQQVNSAAIPESWATGLIHRAKRSLLWRWNTQKPLGASCRDHTECGTNYCRRNVCAFRSFSS
uniref:Liver-expressed antimicrobial peptide 2 n=1 Tax=Denticeps clupeoides TaxID=299321 RepID=A0AAY4ERH0_9TELE